MDDRVSKARELIKQGMPVYKACNEVGLDLRCWYRITTGVDRLMEKHKLGRLKKKLEKLEAQTVETRREIEKICQHLSRAFK